MVLEKLEPHVVWDIFENVIAHTPRPSKSEDKIREVIKAWLGQQSHHKDLKLKITEDGVGNILIKKAATNGLERRPPLLLQGHLDMVCETDRPNGYDFHQQGIPIRIQENREWIDADGTTLGADDVLFTVNEEDGFTGATNLDVKKLGIESKHMINLDSGPLGIITIGSVCGGRVFFERKFEWIEAESNKNLLFMTLSVDGLLSGHSGDDIHLPRANANELISRILSQLIAKVQFHLCEWNGGTKSNVITRKANVKFAFATSDKSTVEDIIKKEIDKIFKYYQSTTEGTEVFEPNLTITWKYGESAKHLSIKDTILIITTSSLIPQGVLRHSHFHEGNVESSNNFAILHTLGENVRIEIYPRSLIRSELESFRRKMVQLGEIGDWNMTLRPVLPEWDPKPKSKFLKYVKEQYENILNKDTQSAIVHGGLETGEISNKIPEIEMVAIGPTVENAHTPNERLKIADIKPMYEILLSIVRNFSDFNNS
ncbi:MAG: M20/M25/M40 family metallo-hydrolase [Candidatus Lokiarchaeota archaeon]